MDNDVKIPVTPQLIIGAAIIVLGALFTLDNLEILDAGNYARYWPLALIVIGLVKMLQARTPPSLGVGAVWIFAGGWLLLQNLGVITWSFWNLWPLLLVVLGGQIVWKGLRLGRQPAVASSAAPAADVDSITALALMSGVGRKSNAKDFRGGDLTAIMGGCEIDLRGASIASSEAVIDTFAFWGGIEIAVPEDWTVVSKVFALMGGYEDRTRPPQGGATKRLIVRGFAIMGGVEVKN